MQELTINIAREDYYFVNVICVRERGRERKIRFRILN